VPSAARTGAARAPSAARRIGVIVNPNARGVRGDPDLGDRLRATLGDAGEVVRTRTPDELDAALDQLLASGCDPIATCGGDGTHQTTLTRLVARVGEERLPRFALLGGGTINTIARNLGVATRGGPAAALARLAARLRTGRPLDERAQDLLVVDGRYGFLFATAMGARFLEAYYAGPTHGRLWAGALAARIALSSLVQGPYARWLFAPVPLALAVDGEPVALPAARMLVASTVPDVGLGMRVAGRAGSEPGRFHLVASSLTTTAMALQLPRVLAGRRLAGHPHLDRLAREVELRFPAPETYTLDGELYRAASVHLRIGPRLRVVHA